MILTPMDPNTEHKLPMSPRAITLSQLQLETTHNKTIDLWLASRYTGPRRIRRSLTKRTVKYELLNFEFTQLSDASIMIF